MSENGESNPSGDVIFSHLSFDVQARIGTDDHLDPPPRPDCPECHGTGIVELLFSHQPCKRCFGHPAKVDQYEQVVQCEPQQAPLYIYPKPMVDYVKAIGERSLEIVGHAPAIKKVLEALGGIVIGFGQWLIYYDSTEKLAEIVQRLCDADLPFANISYAWPPLSVAEMLREDGRLIGSIKEIFCTGPDEVVIQKR